MIPPNSNQGQQQPQQPNNPNPPARSQPAKNPLLPILLVVGILMLGGVAWLTYASISNTRALEAKVAELQEAERLRIELDNQYNQAIAELDKLKGDNEQVNAMIEQQKTELEAQKNQIADLLVEKKKLDSARSEIKNLKGRIAGYIAEIERLKAEQEQLSEDNIKLKEETSTLRTDLQTKSTENEELFTTRAKLVSEKEELTQAVEVGSVVKVKNISVAGEKVRKSGKTSGKEKAKRVDQLKVCFTTVANEIVQPGTEKFFIRIISPKGETLAIDDLGSGSLQNSRTGEEVTFTQSQEYEYANDETQLCFPWKPGVPFEKGKYDVEIYNKGYLAGRSSFELK